MISKFEECDTNLELPGSRPDLCVFIRMQKHSARAWLRNIFLLVQTRIVPASETQHRCYQSLPNLGMNIMTVLCQVRPKSIWSFAPYFGVGIVAHSSLQSTTFTCGTTIRGLPRHRDEYEHRHLQTTELCVSCTTCTTIVSPRCACATRAARHQK